MSRTVTVRCVWVSEHQIEVPDGFRDTGYLKDFPESALEVMDPNRAQLTEWQVLEHGRGVRNLVPRSS